MPDSLNDILALPMHQRRQRLFRMSDADLARDDVTRYLAGEVELLQFLLVNRNDLPGPVYAAAARPLTQLFLDGSKERVTAAPLLLEKVARTVGLPDDVLGELQAEITSCMFTSGRTPADRRRGGESLGILLNDPRGLAGLDVENAFAAFTVRERNIAAALSNPGLTPRAWAMVEMDAVDLPQERSRDPIEEPVTARCTERMSDLALASIIVETASYRPDVSWRMYQRVSTRLRASTDAAARAELLRSEDRRIRADIIAHMGIRDTKRAGSRTL